MSCEYCSNDMSTLIDGNHAVVYMVPGEGKLHVYEYEWMSTESILIRCCPMCGDELMREES